MALVAGFWWERETVGWRTLRVREAVYIDLFNTDVVLFDDLCTDFAKKSEEFKSYDIFITRFFCSVVRVEAR